MSARRVSAVLLAVAAVLLAPAPPAGAQVVVEGSQELDFDRTESWAMKYFASVTQATSFGVPERRGPGELEPAVEYGQVPSLDEAERRVGFDGSTVQDLNRSPYLVRPVVHLGIGGGFTLSAGYLPPVERDGAEPNVLTLALSRPLLDSRSWRLGLRLHGQSGTVEGDFTCSERAVAAGDDPDLNPLGCEEPSRDEHHADTVGVELSAARDFGPDGRWRPWLAVGYQYHDLEFRIDARYSGLIDRQRLLTDGETWSATAGVDYRLAESWRLAAALFYTPLDVVRPPAESVETDALLNLRAALSYRLR